MANEIINDNLFVFKESSLNPISPIENDCEYIYLLREHEEIYKVGKTTRENLFNFPNKYSVLLRILCKDCDNKLKRILKKFRNKFIHRKDIGLEYFVGDPDDMFDIICKINRTSN